VTHPFVTTVNPSTGAKLADYPSMERDAVIATLAEVTDAQISWGALQVEVRADHLRAIARELRSQRQLLADLMTAEMGKPISESMAEVDKCALACDYYAEQGPQALADREVMTEATRSWVSHEPLGVVLAVMPWNFPLWQVLRFAAPCLLAGNAGLLKHSPNVTGCALAIERVFRDAGLPANVFRSLVIEESAVPETTETLIADSRVSAVSLTGSERAGMAVGAAAGRAVKKSLLELGGSDPFIVLADADVELAAAAAVRSRFLNTGQSCLAAKRFIAHRSVVDQFTELFASGVDILVVGDPTRATTQIGPMAREDLASDLRRQLASSVADGARVRTRRTIEQSGGAWFTPTVVDAVTLDMAVMREETFGPLAAVFPVDDDAEAVRAANATPYGLGASVWSRDTARALGVGRQITSGALFVNAVVASDPRLPFGGTKRSGYGRELGSEGAVEFTNVRTYVVGGGSVHAGAGTE